MALMDSSETELSERTDNLLAQLDNCAENSKAELVELVKTAKHYSEVAKDAAEFDPEAYYTKDEANKKIQEAITAISDYDEETF